MGDEENAVPEAPVVEVTPPEEETEKTLEKDSTPAFDNFKNPDQTKCVKKFKKSKKNWKNRYSKQKHKGPTVTDVAEKVNTRRSGHANFKTTRNRLPSLSKFFLPYKRLRKETFIPPTKFLLGGNISDPLNLNSLQDEDINRAMNAVTPKSSPLPTPPRHKGKVDVIIPPDIRDPLNLLNPLDNDEYEKRLEKVIKAKKTRKRTKAKRRSSECGGGNVPVNSPTQASPAKTDQAGPEEPSESKTAELPSPAVVPGPKQKELKLDLSHVRNLKRTISESENSSQKGKARRMDALDKIVSPVVPQPGAWMRVHTRAQHARAAANAAKGRQPRKSINEDGTEPETPESKMPKFKPQDALFQYGNYDRYYGYRNLKAAMDVRLKVFEMHRHLFYNKDVLDIGCNVGHISIAIARELGAKSVKGIDIDDKLIARARRNLINFIEVPEPEKSDKMDTSISIIESGKAEPIASTSVKKIQESNVNSGEHSSEQTIEMANLPLKGNPASIKESQKLKRNRRFQRRYGQDLNKYYFPVSCPILYGPIQLTGYPKASENPRFPHNITFLQTNYILKDENLINAEVPQFDLILCLSVTKWIHLNWGDAGVKMTFKRMFAQLRPGGKLILEAQNWASYKKKNKLTETIYKNYNSIEFLPNKFREYLLSPEVGFSKCCVLGVPQHMSKGFCRPIQLYIKGDFTPSKVQWSDNYAPSSHHQTESSTDRPKIVYANVVSPSYHPSSSRWSDNNTPVYGTATPFSLNLDTAVEESPFYNPRSDSYLPSYSESGQAKNVYASLSSPQSESGGTPTHSAESVKPRSRVYTSMASPASPFIEPSPGRSMTPSRAFTPSHSSNFDAQGSQKKVYASLQSPLQDGASTPHHPAYSPSVAGTSNARHKYLGGSSPLHTGANLHRMDNQDAENTNSSESIQINRVSSGQATPSSSPSVCDQSQTAESAPNHIISPSGSIDDIE